MSPSRRTLLGFASACAILAAHPALATYIPRTPALFNALDYGVKGDGVTNDGTAINTFLTFAGANNGIAYFPNLTYECGGASLVVPAGVEVLCAPTATLRRSVNPLNFTTSSGFVTMGSNCRWYGGILTNTATTTTSTTSNTIGTGSKTFTVGSGLGLTNGMFFRIYNTATPANYVEGTVSSYSGTTLVMSISFSNGSGTFTAWTVVPGAVYQAPMVLRGVSNTIVEGVTLTGLWYEGFLFDGNGLSAATGAIDCTFKSCFAVGVMNRAFDYYGYVTRCNVIDGHVVSNSATPTDYGVNCNAANTGGSQAIVDCNIVGMNITGTYFQGIGIGDICRRITVTGCVIDTVTNSSGVGIELIFANSNSPSDILISNCTVQSAAGQGFGLFGAVRPLLTGCKAISCGVGFQVGSGSSTATTEAQLTGIDAQGNTTGVQVDTGISNTILIGRSANNTTNVTDNGTSTVKTNLATS